MKIVIIGAKASGKSSLGRELARLLQIKYCETDSLLEDMYYKDTGRSQSCKEIFDILGKEDFRKLEEKAVQAAADLDWQLIITGGSTFISPANRKILRKD
ncbi:MAG TPA: shikimate kinase, partial [Spirochaetota bacterium]|nr:shikimate kinase [Spirochaetota bacterium]